MNDTSKSTETTSSPEESTEETQSQNVPPVLVDFLQEFNTGMKRLAK